VLAVGAALHLAYYAFYQRAYYSWYFLPLVVAAAALKGVALERARPAIAGAVLAGSAVTCAATLHRYIDFVGYHPRITELRYRPFLQKLAALPPGSRVGVWNAGRMAYFAAFAAPHIRIVNLDGVVNNDLYAALRRGQYLEYLAAECDFLGEAPGRLEAFVGAPAARAFIAHRLSAVPGSARPVTVAPIG
jgi:hypothetical protein